MKAKTRRSKFCDCGRRKTYWAEACDDCNHIDGWAYRDREVIAELQHGYRTASQLAAVTGWSKKEVRDVLSRLRGKGRVATADGLFWLGRQWDTRSDATPLPRVSAVSFSWLENAALPDHGEWHGQVVSGPIGEGRFPGRRFNDKSTARTYYSRRYRIVEEINIQAPRYIFRVEVKHEESISRDPGDEAPREPVHQDR